MKQTVEEAAKEARMASAETLTTYGTHTSLDDFTYLSHDEIAEAAFIKGAEWQSKQSPWISIDKGYPEDKQPVLCSSQIYGKVVLCWDELSQTWNYPGSSEFCCDWYKVDCWQPIPSFDEILEENRDVLERIKEKGD